MGLWESFLSWLLNLFFKHGIISDWTSECWKDFTCKCYCSGGYSEDIIPTVGFNIRKVRKGNVPIKLWDLRGQPRFAAFGDVIVQQFLLLFMLFMLQIPDVSISKSELHDQ